MRLALTMSTLLHACFNALAIESAPLPMPPPQTQHKHARVRSSEYVTMHTKCSERTNVRIAVTICEHDYKYKRVYTFNFVSISVRSKKQMFTIFIRNYATLYESY